MFDCGLHLILLLCWLWVDNSVALVAEFLIMLVGCCYCSFTVGLLIVLSLIDY